MIVVLGGCGFIGSHVIAELEARGKGPIIVVDTADGEKWRNISKRTIEAFVSPHDLGVLEWSGVTAVIHMGAASSTSESDGQRVVEANIQPFEDVWRACAGYGVPLIYASSAAVYGLDDGRIDNDTPEWLATLRPLNAYGWSKKVCDQNAATWSLAGDAPPSWVGLRFFNVYGSNESHKGDQRSYVSKAMEAAIDGQPLTFYRGDFRRDWVYVEDVARLIADMVDLPPPSGIYNIGTGESRSFQAVLDTVEKVVGLPIIIDHRTMPLEMMKRYQPRTWADMGKFSSVLRGFQFASLEEGVRHYYQTYGSDPYR